MTMLVVPKGKPVHQVFNCPTVISGPLSSGSVTNLMLVTAFNNYLTPRSAEVW